MYYQVKHYLKWIRWQIRRRRAALRWGLENLHRAPIVFGNAMPKSGSHLIIQILEGLTELGPFVNPGFPPVNRFEDNSHLRQEKVLANIRRMRPGDIRYGYLHAREPFLSLLTEPGRATVFVYRDPRDVIISHIFYATDIHKGHGMHDYYTQELDSMEARINAAIAGVEKPGSQISGIREKYDSYLGWLKQPDVLSLRFEALVLDQDNTLGRLLDFLQEHGFTPQVSRKQAVETLKRAIAPEKSGTFRKGQPGNWQDHFTDENKKHFKTKTGELLQILGYEREAGW